MDDLSFYLSELEKRKLLPKNIEVARWFDWTIVSCFDSKSSEYISESVRMGIDKDQEVAFMKALTENCERVLSKTSEEKNITAYGRSDGFAAFPILNNNVDLAMQRGRQNAYNEAVERFLWANWWDDRSIAFSISAPGISAVDSENLSRQFNLDSLNEIQILDSSKSYCLSILLAKVKSGGYVTGGACSQLQDRRRYAQAYGELLRHLFVTQNSPNLETSNLSFYEKRLFSFASGKLNPKVEERLNAVGNKSIVLPKLELDNEIKHSEKDLIYLHRCYFKNQPIFMGGEIERLCI